MKLITKTAAKIVFEVTQKEYEEKGFDALWDEIRVNYPEKHYDLHTVEHKENFYFELKPSKPEQ
jgi:hypothetical protein